MARDYVKENALVQLHEHQHTIYVGGLATFSAILVVVLTGFAGDLSPTAFFLLGGLLPPIIILITVITLMRERWTENERQKESERRGGKEVLGMPPQRNAFSVALKDAQQRGKVILDKYLVGFELDNGAPIWVSDDELCSHACVFAKTGVGKTLWLEGMMFQQMARGRASGFTFIDAKRDPGTLADLIMMALMTGRIEDVVVVDPFDPVCAYNFVFTAQRADVKARKVLRCGLPPTSDASTTKHYDRLAADAVSRVVRAMESLGLAWSVRDIAVALSAFTIAYPRIRSLLHEIGAKDAMIELGHLAGSYRNPKGGLDTVRLTDNLRGIASELHSISNSEAGEMFCAPRADLSLTDAILRGKIIYYMLPRLEEAEGAARMVKVFREDLEVSIGEVTSSREWHLEDPHMVIIDEGASTFGPTWANLFELARKGRFALLFGAQSIGGLMDQTMGLSEQFYERVMANVNLKVIMRIGDNRTAMDMTEWIGKINVRKESISSAVSEATSARELTKNIELNRRSSDTFRDAVTVAEDEEDLVSAEELKHEMSAEKGLAWFDKGDGRLRKGRAIWFNAELPETWEGRENLTRYETVEADEIGLAEWVDENILHAERLATEKEARPPQEQPAAGAPGGNTPAKPNGESSDQKPAEDAGGNFRLNMMKGYRGMNRSRTFVSDTPEEETKEEKKEAPKKSSGLNFGSDEPKQSAPEAAPSSTPKQSTKNEQQAAPKSEKSQPKKNIRKGGLQFKGKSRDTVASPKKKD